MSITFFLGNWIDDLIICCKYEEKKCNKFIYSQFINIILVQVVRNFDPLSNQNSILPIVPRSKAEKTLEILKHLQR
jgi:hypothetical protein